jgi:hypothetical protein
MGDDTIPRCQDCCEERWAPLGKEFIEALTTVEWKDDWAEKIAACALVDLKSDGNPTPANAATELTPTQVKALGDLHEIVDAKALAADFNELSDSMQEKVLHLASVIFAETFLRLKHDELWRTQQHDPLTDPEERCQRLYDVEFPSDVVDHPPAIVRHDSGHFEDTFISPRFSSGLSISPPPATQSSLAFLWELVPSGKMDPGASSRQQETTSDEPETDEVVDHKREGH